MALFFVEPGERRLFAARGKDPSMNATDKLPPDGTSSFSNRRVELERFEAQLAEWTAMIGGYRASARRVEGQARVQLDTITDDLQRRRNEAGAQVLQLKSTADAEWEHEKSKVEQSWQTVRSSFQKAKARF
jgi:hypothetical protein